LADLSGILEGVNGISEGAGWRESRLVFRSHQRIPKSA
jgi:hypothetical protein